MKWTLSLCLLISTLFLTACESARGTPDDLLWLQPIEFQKETKLALDVSDSIVNDNRKKFFAINDFGDLVARTKGFRKKRLKDGEVLYEESPKVWDEMNDIATEETEVEKQNRTYNLEKLEIKQRLNLAIDKMEKTYGYQNPKSRIILEERVNFLLKKIADFDYKINPYHIQPGLILEMDLVTTKRKRYIMNGMSNVLNEFLSAMSKGFEDGAFAAFSRRRSTVRQDIEQDFQTVEDNIPDAVAGDDVDDEPTVPPAPPVSDDGDFDEL